MKFFTGDDFQLNSNLTFTKEDVNGRPIVYVDNVYKNPLHQRTSLSQQV